MARNKAGGNGKWLKAHVFISPGAGKTIMAGLLLKELKARGLVRRTLVVAPANLTFQWQRERLDKFRETFEVVRGETLRTTYGLNHW